MADLQKPTAAKRGLPFKRTVKQKAPSDASPAVDDDGLALFSQSKTYFPTVIEDQQKRAREKAEKEEQERKKKLERDREESERKARDAQLGRERRRRELQDEMKEKESAKKRRKYSLDSDDEKPKYNEDEDDDDFADKSSKSLRQSSPLSLGSGRDPSASRSSRAPETTRKTRAASRTEPDVVLLESSDDEDGSKVESSGSKTRSKTRSGGSQVEPTRVDLKGKGIAEDSDSDLEMLEDKKENKEGADGEEDPSEFYIKAAMERRRKAEEARRARGTSAVGDRDKNSSNTPGFDDDERGAPVSVMIAAPTLPDAKALCCTVRTAQALQIAFDTYKERLKIQTAYPHKTVSELVFTWRGDRVYNTTKLETLGICPRGDDGRLHDKTKSGRDAPEGYVGKDKVYFEAWTPEEYEENQQKRERERKRREMGEWWDEDDTANDNDGGNADDAGAAEAEAESPPKEDDRVRVIFKAKNMPPRNVTLRKYSTVAHMIKAFRKLAGVGEDKHVEIRWDGEALDAETTVEEADIGDMDSVEVHIR